MRKNTFNHVLIGAVAALAAIFTSCTVPFAELTAATNSIDFVDSFSDPSPGSVRVGVQDDSTAANSIRTLAAESPSLFGDAPTTFVVSLNQADATGPAIEPAVISMDPEGRYPTVLFEEVTPGIWSFSVTAHFPT